MSCPLGRISSLSLPETSSGTVAKPEEKVVGGAVPGAGEGGIESPETEPATVVEVEPQIEPRRRYCASDSCGRAEGEVKEEVAVTAV